MHCIRCISQDFVTTHDILFGAQFSAHLFAVIRFGVQKSLFTIMALFLACELPNLHCEM